MRRTFLIFALFFVAAMAWGMPPKPDSGLTYDGSLNATPFESCDGVLKAPSKLSYATTKTTGSKKILVLLVKFPSGFKVPALDFNKKNNVDWSYGCSSGAKTHDCSYYKELLEDGSGLTMTQYYKDMSNDALNLEFAVLGPYTAKHDYTHYGRNLSSGSDAKVEELVQEMLENEEVQADITASGTLDGCTVIVIHAGPGEENGVDVSDADGKIASNFIWSCCSWLSSSITIGGTTFSQYTVQPEYVISNGKTEASVGVFCHEFGHVLGLPDLYDTSYDTAGVGNWSLMSGGSWGSGDGTDPAPLMNCEKATLGWIGESLIAPSAKAMKIDFENSDGATKLLRINLTEDGSQYLVFDGKKKSTEKYVAEGGLLITHIHEGVYKKNLDSNTVNRGASCVHGLSVVEAKSDYYDTNGLGRLWQGSESKYRTTTEACFRSDTATSVGPVVDASTSEIDPLFVVLIKTILTSAVLAGFVFALCCGRKKVCLLFTGVVAMFFLCMACDVGGGSGSGSSGEKSTYKLAASTNYYTDTGDVYSKTGNSGVKIYDIQCNSDGSGSFWVVKE